MGITSTNIVLGDHISTAHLKPLHTTYQSEMDEESSQGPDESMDLIGW